MIDHVGNCWWSRDAIDARVINNVLTNTGPPNGIGAAAPNAAELAGVLGAPTVITHRRLGHRQRRHAQRVGSWPTA